MKTILLSTLLLIIYSQPEVNVNYKPKKQWKVSKHDLADIKLDIEREVEIINQDESQNTRSSTRLGKS